MPCRAWSGLIFVPDPIGFGLVENLARPGGNATGLSLVACDVRDLVAVEGKADMTRTSP